MAGRGPTPKPANRRVRQGSDPLGVTTLRHEVSKAPDLPDGVVWPAQTLAWWRVWRTSPQAELFGATDWQFLLETAKIHAKFCAGGADGFGDMSVAGELRLREAKLGATVEDRLRLRMSMAEADEKDAKRPAKTSRDRFGDLRAVASE